MCFIVRNQGGDPMKEYSSDKILKASKDVEAAIGTYGLTDYEQVAVLETVKFSILMTSWKKAELLYSKGVRS